MQSLVYPIRRFTQKRDLCRAANRKNWPNMEESISINETFFRFNLRLFT